MRTRGPLALLALAPLIIPGQTSLEAQARGGRPPVQVTPTRLGDNFYAIDGRGGRMGALVGPEGVFLVDAQFPDVTELIVAAIREITDRPLRLLVNTHVHGDHTGGNENFARQGVTIMARPMLRQRLANPSPNAAGNRPPPAPTMALPVITYDEKTTLHLNGETVELIPLREAHTDGDTAIRFANAGVLMTGDVYRSTGYPNIDLNNGGTLGGMLAALQLLVELAGPNTTVVPGHGEITNREAIVAHRAMAITIP